jgi:hypothetical protein
MTWTFCAGPSKRKKKKKEVKEKGTFYFKTIENKYEGQPGVGGD